VTALRLVADDAAVFDLTHRAAVAAGEIPDPPLRIGCQRCGAVLARAGDTDHGPLFTSSWQREPGLAHEVHVGGRRLSRSKTIDHLEHDIVERSGRPMHAPVTHGAVALLALPTDVPADYPDLLVRCDKHGDAVLDRRQVLDWLRDAAVKPTKRKVVVSRPFSDYVVPTRMPGTTGHTRYQREVYRLGGDVMTVAEFEAKRADRIRRWHERRAGS
jgi:hypothetical protein